MGSGMCMPSIGIYSHELYTEYGVEKIIRIGSAGSYKKDVKVYDVVLAQGACTNSNWAHQYGLPGVFSAIADFDMLKSAYDVAKAKGINVHVGNILSSDPFYDDNVGSEPVWKKWERMNVLAVEMESYALYCNAARLGKKALCILTISDSFVSHEITSAEERQTAFKEMMEIALEIA